MPPARAELERKFPDAAFPVPGPIDIVNDRVGALSEDLDRTIAAALFSSWADFTALGQQFSWEEATRHFVAGLVPLAAELSVAA